MHGTLETHVLKCSCGWTYEASTRRIAAMWKADHRRQFTTKGQRMSDCGHVVTITKKDTDDRA